MICVSLSFRCSLLFLVLFMAIQTLVTPGNSANSTPVSSTATKCCNNNIEGILQEMKKQLIQVQDDISILKRAVAKGNLNGEFWLVLDKINRLTKTVNRLRVDLEDTAGKTVYAEYDMFAVTSEGTKYQLSLGTYSGTAGDSLSYHRGQPFTTKDQDHDTWSKGNCAVSHKGAWWYGACHDSNLNGLYHHGKHSSGGDGVNWGAWKGHYYSAKRAEMKIRPVIF